MAVGMGGGGGGMAPPPPAAAPPRPNPVPVGGGSVGGGGRMPSVTPLAARGGDAFNPDTNVKTDPASNIGGFDFSGLTPDRIARLRPAPRALPKPTTDRSSTAAIPSAADSMRAMAGMMGARHGGAGGGAGAGMMPGAMPGGMPGAMPGGPVMGMAAMGGGAYGGGAAAGAWR